MSIDIFGFRALWSPYYLTCLVIVTISYFWFVAKYRQKRSQGFVLSKRQVFYFLLAMFLLYIVKGSPIDLMSHIMFSAHMTQMAIYLVIPPLFIISIPDGLWRVWIMEKDLGTLDKLFFPFLLNHSSLCYYLIFYFPSIIFH